MKDFSNEKKCFSVIFLVQTLENSLFKRHGMKKKTYVLSTYLFNGSDERAK